MTSVQHEHKNDTDVQEDVRPSEVAAARLKLVTSRRLGKQAPKWVEKLAKAEPKRA